jgi:hypothetical protein
MTKSWSPLTNPNFWVFQETGKYSGSESSMLMDLNHFGNIRDSTGLIVAEHVYDADAQHICDLHNENIPIEISKMWFVICRVICSGSPGKHHILTTEIKLLGPFTGMFEARVFMEMHQDSCNRIHSCIRAMEIEDDI